MSGSDPPNLRFCLAFQRSTADVGGTRSTHGDHSAAVFTGLVLTAPTPLIDEQLFGVHGREGGGATNARGCTSHSSGRARYWDGVYPSGRAAVGSLADHQSGRWAASRG